MAAPPTDEITQLLRAWREGDDDALALLIPLVEDELRRLAKLYLSRERRNHTLQTTALVNEAYLRLIPQREKDWQNRAHFIGVAAGVMLSHTSLAVERFLMSRTIRFTLAPWLASVVFVAA